MNLNHLWHSKLLLCLSLAATAAQAAPPALNLDPKKIDRVFADYNGTTPGCAIGLYRNGKILFARGYGLADLNHRVPIEPRTVFDIGSTSKQFTALAIVLLAHDGKLSLKDRVSQYLPALSPAHASITLEQMLWHTAGLRDYNELMLLAGYAEEDPTGEAEALRVISHQAGLNFAPGSRFSYSNSGYFLAALVVERVSAMGLDAFLQQRVFQPLKMAATHVRTDHTQVVRHRATAYRQLDTGYAINMANWNQPGDGAVQSTVQDLAKWDAELANPRVLPASVIRALKEPGKLSDGQALGYALGLEVGQYRGLPRIAHDGAWAGYRATYMQFPDQKFGLALTCNSAEADPNALAEQVIDIVLAKHLAADTSTRSPQTKKALDESAVDASGFVGQYLENQGSEVIHITQDGAGKLLWQDVGEATELLVLAPDKVKSKSGKTQLQLSPQGLVLHRRGEALTKTLSRLAPHQTDAVSTSALAGHYGSDELGVQWELQRHQGLTLQLQSRALGNPVLHSLTPDLWQGPHFLLRVQRDPQGLVSGFVYESELVSGLRFKRLP
jgi:CubicO group peptidase (beta-lactamase class C family)